MSIAHSVSSFFFFLMTDKLSIVLKPFNDGLHYSVLDCHIRSLESLKGPIAMSPSSFVVC